MGESNFFALALTSGGFAAYRVWKPEREKVEELQNVIEQSQHKQKLLDEISDLRVELVEMRIQMENSRILKTISEAEWANRFEKLQLKIASKIEQFASKAEAQAYRHRGNINRTANSYTGGFLNPLHIDLCIHDIDYLRTFIHDYSRQKERSTSG